MKIEFVSYDGAYPNLCSGTFVVKLDGVETSFGSQFLWEYEKKAGKVPPTYPKFWTSGGGVAFDEDWSEIVSVGDWELMFDEKDYPPEIAAAMSELIRVFNENVPPGCCGGCV